MKNQNQNHHNLFFLQEDNYIKPNWNKDILFRISGEFMLSHQCIESWEILGVVKSNVKAQKSTHIVLGNEYSFEIADRPFKLTSEVYYKNERC